MALRRLLILLALGLVLLFLVPAAAGFCRVIFPAAAVSAANLGIPLPAPWATTGVVLTAEFIMTFLLMTAIFGTAVDERGQAVKIGGFGIGLTVAFDILAGGAVTGASMNPARSFGPALEMNYWAFHWMYWVAPISGAVVAALMYDNLLMVKSKDSGLESAKGPRG